MDHLTNMHSHIFNTHMHHMHLHTFSVYTLYRAESGEGSQAGPEMMVCQSFLFTTKCKRKPSF